MRIQGRDVSLCAILAGLMALGVLVTYRTVWTESPQAVDDTPTRRESERGQGTSEPISFRDVFTTEGEIAVFEGHLFSDQATTTLSLYRRTEGVHEEHMQGGYIDEGGLVSLGQGTVQGTYVADSSHQAVLYFIEYPGIAPSAHATATLRDTGEELSGVFDWYGVTTSRPFTLKKRARTPEDVQVTMHRIKASWQSAPFIDVCEVEIEYPRVNDVVLNRLIDTAITGSATTDIQGYAMNGIKDCQDRAKETAARPQETFVRSQVRVQTIITLNQDGLLSFFFQGNVWGGGAHQIRKNASITLDVDKRRAITLGDLVEPSRLQDFLTYQNQLVLDKVYQEMRTSQPISSEAFSVLEDV